MFIFDKRRPLAEGKIKGQIKIKSGAGLARQAKGPGGKALPQPHRQLGDYRRRQGPLRSRPRPFLLAPGEAGGCAGCGLRACP